MSTNFCTPIPIDLTAVKALLPPDAEIERDLVWNRENNTVELRWSSRMFFSPYSFHHQFTVDALRRKELPRFVGRYAQVLPPPTTPEIYTPAVSGNDNEKTVDAGKKRSRKGTA